MPEITDILNFGAIYDEDEYLDLEIFDGDLIKALLCTGIESEYVLIENENENEAEKTEHILVINTDEDTDSDTGIELFEMDDETGVEYDFETYKNALIRV